MAGSIPETTAEVADLLDRVARRIRRATAPQLEALGVTWAQVRALRALAASGAPIRMSELADRLRIARRSATSIVDELAERGLVERGTDPSDRRAVTVAVTPAGAALLRTLADKRREAASGLTTTLHADELTTLRDLLRRLDADPGLSPRRQREEAQD